MVQTDDDWSLGDDKTSAGSAKKPRPDVSLGDGRTVGDTGLVFDGTLLDGIEVVDLAERYAIDGTLGQGGMGAVLLATDTRLGRKVAIKRILGEAARSKAALARFLTEARAIAAISHPNVVQIYELGVATDGPFLVIEYIDGGSLLDRCKAGPISPDEAVSLVCQSCDGLAKAHDLGIIHRDIKPANILLTKDGTAKLTDFGLAKAESVDHGQTMAGAVLGTPDFMPPEQRRDAALVDHRSDLWSLAATLYQAVSGRSPKVIRLHELPAELQPIIGKALEEEKDSRYQSIREFRDALRAIRDGGHKSTAPAQLEGVLQEGQCKACGTVTSDLTRKFCRNPKCGVSLRAACLKCEAQIPVWDGVCGECGGNQPALLKARWQFLAAEQVKAEKLVAALAFDEAVVCAKDVAKECRPEFATFVAWATSFVESTTKERDRLQAEADQSLAKARESVKACDYQAAIRAIETIPERMRCSEALHLLATSTSRHEETNRLIEFVRSRVETGALDGLLPSVEEIIRLQGSSVEFTGLRDMLAERRRQAVREERRARHAARRLLLADLRRERREVLDACLAAGVASETTRCLLETTAGPIVLVIQRSWCPSGALWFASAIKSGALEAAEMRADDGPRPAGMNAECQDFLDPESPCFSVDDYDFEALVPSLRISPRFPMLGTENSPPPILCAKKPLREYDMLVAIDTSPSPEPLPEVVLNASGHEGELVIGWIDVDASANTLASLRDSAKRHQMGYLLGLVTSARLGSPPECQNLVPWLERGLELEKESRWEESAASFEAAVAENPQALQAWLGIGRVLKKLGRFAEGAAVMERALEAKPKSSLLLYNLACYRALAGHADQARECLARAIAKRPEFQELAKKDPDFESMRRDVAFVMMLNDRDPARKMQADLERGLRLSERGRYEQAIEHLCCFVERHPHVADAWVAIGRCLVKLDRPSEAAEMMLQGLDACGNQPRLMYNLACYGSLAGRGEEALRALMKAIALNPEYAAAANKDTDLNAIRSDPRFAVIVSRPDES